MVMTKASDIIESLLPEMDEVHNFNQIFRENGRRVYSPKKNSPLWMYYGKDFETAYKRAYANQERAISNMRTAAEVLGVSIATVWEAVATARRWYIKTEYVRPLPDAYAEKIWLQAATNNKRN